MLIGASHDVTAPPPPPDVTCVEDRYLPLPAANALLEAYRKRYPMVVRSATDEVEADWGRANTLDAHLKRILESPQARPPPPSSSPLRFTQLASNIPRAAIGSQAHGPPGANVFVFHIPNEWDEHELAVHFAQFGPILSARIATEKASGRRLGFGFVSYTEVEPACRAVSVLNGYPVAGKRLKVTIKRGEQQHVAGQMNAPPRQTKPSEKPENRGRPPLCANFLDKHCTCACAVEEASEQGRRTSSTTTPKVGRKARLSPSDISSVKTRNTNAKSLPEAATSSGGSSDEDQHTFDTDSAAATLRRIENLFSRILEKLDDAPCQEADWLHSLSSLLKASQGRQFVYTLLQAAGLTTSELEESPPQSLNNNP